MKKNIMLRLWTPFFFTIVSGSHQTVTYRFFARQNFESQFSKPSIPLSFFPCLETFGVLKNTHSKPSRSTWLRVLSSSVAEVVPAVSTPKILRKMLVQCGIQMKILRSILQTQKLTQPDWLPGQRSIYFISYSIYVFLRILLGVPAVVLP